MKLKVSIVPPSILLRSHDKLTSISKEQHNRTQKGKVLAYVCEDRQKDFLFLTQKISHIADVINAVIARDEFETVSVAGLYQSMTNPRHKTNKWVKMRWKIHPVPIDDALYFYDSMRANGYKHCTVLGNPEKYSVTQLVG